MSRGILITPTLRRISSQLVNNVYKVVMFLVAYVATLPVPNMVSLFADVVQTLTLLRAPNIEEYLDARLRRAQYSLIHPTYLLAVLERCEKNLICAVSKVY